MNKAKMALRLQYIRKLVEEGKTLEHEDIDWLADGTEKFLQFIFCPVCDDVMYLSGGDEYAWYCKKCNPQLTEVLEKRNQEVSIEKESSLNDPV